MAEKPIILLIRREMRLHDHPALFEAARSGAPVIPLLIRDDDLEGLGAAPKWRLGQAIEAFSARLAAQGARLILRSGAPEAVLRALIAEAGAGAVYWTRRYHLAGREADAALKAALRADGVGAESFAGSLLHEPWQIATQEGGPYRVFTPFWKALRGIGVAPPLPAPQELRAPIHWPDSENLADWAMGAAMNRGAAVVARHARVGEETALAQLAEFCDGPIEGYATGRDFPARLATSGLSEPLSVGEISPRQIWHAGLRARDEGRPDAEDFLRELAWRDFAWHLLYHFPQMEHANWRPGWEGFPWRGDSPVVERWRRGQTGEPFVDAAMREMFVTGRMHNRARMIAASYLTKHLLTDWRVGQAWFAECLTDWDRASNAMGWQWVAGCGPDAAPYFRIFNPVTQAKKFDPEGAYLRAWIAEGQRHPPDTALAFFEAAPRSWGLSPGAPPPRPLVDLAEGRTRALAAYETLRRAGG
ncbi:cryptochrome/photolyase family protein [Pseudothioclava arenosa]|uniref:Deoxyribodipyrimidine photolyase n=1 Tax=Pseudothioclava arenosa TaxID=1795308 RepID=A0A2A4CN26_9RHOB|nr:deoxyribodipyrimidine photo-lyase [Pseudothioclava arenosa]PCD75730.1 deoxyribodipyrimidine photolyase [Pseudothioclava arenosa]